MCLAASHSTALLQPGVAEGLCQHSCTANCAQVLLPLPVPVTIPTASSLLLPQNNILYDLAVWQGVARDLRGDPGEAQRQHVPENSGDSAVGHHVMSVRSRGCNSGLNSADT